MTPAIVLSSHTTGLGVIRALGTMGVPVSVVYNSKNDSGYLSKYVKESFFAPHPEKCEDDYVAFLMDRAEKYRGSVLMPADDATLVTVSRNKAALEQWYRVACADWDITERIIDKKYSCALAEELGVPAPKSVTPSSLEEVKAFSSSTDFPCVIKPSIGHRYFEIFDRKMVLVHNPEELLEHYLEAEQYGLEMMIQEYIPGDDTCGVNFNSYRHAGESIIEFTSEKVRLSPPNFGVPRAIVSKEVPDVIQPGRKILESLGYSGYACTEFKRDERDGVYKFMEINGRQNFSVLHALKCGINFPWITYRHLVSGELPKAGSNQDGVYWIDLTKDVLSSVRYRRQEKYSWSQYLKPYLRPHVFAILDFKDIKPFIKRCAVLGAMGVRALFTKARSCITR